MTRLKNKSLWQCPGCGYLMSDVCHSNLIYTLDCIRCKKYNTDDFIEKLVGRHELDKDRGF